MPTTKAAQSQYETHLDSTIEAIDEHVKKESPTGVTSSISSWIKTLGSHEEFKDIASDLEDLKTALSDKDGQKIAELLAKLGEATTAAAEKAEGKEGSKVKKLGKALTMASKAVAKLAK
jgi:hypothetical protein